MMIMKIPQEPRLDPDCNQFKDFLVDHPCLNAKLKGYPRRHHDDDGGDIYIMMKCLFVTKNEHF